MRIRQLSAAATLAVAAIGLSACATGLPTKVTRYSALPIPQGQSFYVVPGKDTKGGLEFGSYASIVSQQLQAKGYVPAGAPQNADLLVRLAYDVGDGRTHVRVDPFYDPFYHSYYGRPFYSRYGYYGRYRSPFYYGWHDPFFYGSPYGRFGNPVRTYTVYESELDMDIVRRADNASLFEGRAKARSQTDELGVLVPNLIEAMFTNFPGRNGETVRITVPAKN